MAAPRSQIPFEPGLEGLRGISVIAVLLFHAGFGWAAGGYLGVSTFFTLSGFLITSLLWSENDSTGRIDLGAFWARRFRRLMPAALLALAAITGFAGALATDQQMVGLRGDVLWALGYAANWRLLASDVAYAQIFSAPSPIQHFWSLAIEEQFYVVYPLLALAGFALSRRAFAIALWIAAAISVLVGRMLFDAGGSLDRIYYGTDTRAAEFLIGAGLAAAQSVWRDRAVLRAGSGLSMLGVAALVLMLWMWSTVDVTSAWLYRGGFALHALVSAAVIAAAVAPASDGPGGPVRALLSAGPIRWVGKVSYGAYLYHWPIFMWLDADRSLNPTLRFALQVGLTLVLAGASYRWIEYPIRTGRLLAGWRSWVAAPSAAAAVAIGVWSVTATLPETGLDFSEPTVERAPTGSDARIAVYGDSTALRLGVGLRRWMAETDGVSSTNGVVLLGCGIDQRGWRINRGQERPLSAKCELRDARWRENLAAFPPEIAVVLTGNWEVADRRLPGDSQWRHMGEPVFDAYIRAELLRATDALIAGGATVVWLTGPTIADAQRLVPAEDRDRSLDPARMQRFNELVRELEVARPGKVFVFEFGAHVEMLPQQIAGAPTRPDGVHLTNAAAFEVSKHWLGPKLLTLLQTKPPRATRSR